MSYCNNCGTMVEGSDAYCKNCGTTTFRNGNGFRPDPYQTDRNNNYRPSNDHKDSGGLGGTLTVIMVMGILWGVASILLGALFMIGFSFMYLIGPLVGWLCLTGGVLAIVSCIFICKLEKYQIAFACCLIGSIIALITGGIVIGIVGIIFAVLLNTKKYKFRS